jgi:amino acid adenylation domain-containing protein
MSETAGTGPSFPAGSLHEVFRAQAASRPSDLAIDGPGTKLTYAELDALSDLIAAKLSAAGVEPGGLVGVRMPRGPLVPAAIVGVLKHGSAYVPVDPAYPAARQRVIVEDARLTTVIEAPGKGAGLPRIRRLKETPGGRSLQHALPPDAVYVIYTSGSTGRPKGVVVGQRQLMAMFEAASRCFQFGPGDAWTLYHSHSFDISVWELWGAHLHGGRSVVVPSEVARDGDSLAGLLAESGTTVLNQVPTAFSYLVSALKRRPRQLPDLRYVVLAGEAVDLAAVRRWHDLGCAPNAMVVNMYGPTETGYVTFRKLSPDDHRPGPPGTTPIGLPMAHLEIDLIDEAGKSVPDGEAGEILIGGDGVSYGYLDRPELTAERFIHRDGDARRWYRSGDWAVRHDGELWFVGRRDSQVQLRGFRVELGEVEAAVSQSPLVQGCAVVLEHSARGEPMLVAYWVAADDPLRDGQVGLGSGGPATETDLADQLRAFVAARLPGHMVPAYFRAIDALPRTANGKLDRDALAATWAEGAGRSAPAREYVAPASARAKAVCALWERLLGVSPVGLQDGFFELGGNSLLAQEMLSVLREELSLRPNVARFFEHPTVAGMLREQDQAPRLREPYEREGSPAVAVVGMACRFPGARDIREFWQNLRNGVESTQFFSEDEIDPNVPAEMLADPAYVRARALMPEAECFDAGFFGMSNAEADLTDPQQRVFLETAWEALEDAGIVPERADLSIGVFAGTGNNTYYLTQVQPGLGLDGGAGELQRQIASEKDYVATRTAYKLDLTGPAITVQTACSTSLVAVAQACESLRAGGCDAAIAGGASVHTPLKSGYLYQEGGMLSGDGITRTFAKDATGTVFTSGAGAVVLKRLEDASENGDHVYAVIKGVGLSNDGGQKASFTAPSARGQAQAILRAQQDAGIEARSISYIEAHGTATPLGDPIEVEALTQAFRANGAQQDCFCSIGSVKTNFGHLVAAAGIAGLIKTCLALQAGELPPSLHFDEPNPHIDFARTPFVVQRTLTPWTPPPGVPRRAGVSSFGVGGTNAHVILEGAPPSEADDNDGQPQLLLLSARDQAALSRASERLAAHLTLTPEPPLRDVAYTLARGRRVFPVRRFVVARTADQARDSLIGPVPASPTASEVVFVFPGQGSQHPGMGRALYAAYPMFRSAVDRCADLLKPLLADSPATDLRALMFADEDDPMAVASLRETRVAQPAIFTLEYALAQLWLSWGVTPARMIGHSIGEFVAAHLAGVMSLEDALRLVAARGHILQEMPAGAMLSVRAPAERLVPLLDASLSVAAINAPNLCVVAGPEAAIDALAARLEADETACSRLSTSHAFHSSMMDAAVPRFARHLQRVPLAPPHIPIISTVTGSAMSPENAASADYWARHLRATVRFADAVLEAFRAPAPLLLEVGPRNGVTQLVRQCGAAGSGHLAVASLDGKPGAAEQAAMLTAAGRLFAAGIFLKPDALFPSGRHVSLPAYPFEREVHFIRGPKAIRPGDEPQPAGALEERASEAISRFGEQLIAAQLHLMDFQLRILAASDLCRRRGQLS